MQLLRTVSEGAEYGIGTPNETVAFFSFSRNSYCFDPDWEALKPDRNCFDRDWNAIKSRPTLPQAQADADFAARVRIAIDPKAALGQHRSE